MKSEFAVLAVGLKDLNDNIYSDAENGAGAGIGIEAVDVGGALIVVVVFGGALIVVVVVGMLCVCNIGAVVLGVCISGGAGIEVECVDIDGTDLDFDGAVWCGSVG